jgi:hypothetical protein
MIVCLGEQAASAAAIARTVKTLFIISYLIIAVKGIAWKRILPFEDSYRIPIVESSTMVRQL